MEKATALIFLLALLAFSMVVSADNWTLNFIERDTAPWWRGSGSVRDPSATFSIYVGPTLVKTFSTIGTDYDYGNVSVDLSSNDPTGQTIKLAFYGSGDIIYYLYNINLKKNGQYVKFTPFTVVDTSNEQIHYDNSFREDRIVATIESAGWVNFTTATIATAPELQINPSALAFNKVIYTINQGDNLQINATVNNIGSATDSGVVVKLYINDALTSTSATQSIAAGATATFSFAYTADFKSTNRIKVTVQAVPSGTEGMAWNNNATKYILKHPYFYTMNFSNSPAVAYGGSAPYSTWLASLSSSASYDTNIDYSTYPYETTKSLYAMQMSLYGNIKGLSTYQNDTMTALLYAGKGNWCFFNRSLAGGTAEGSGGTWSLYGSCAYDTYGADWGQITQLYAMAYDWDANYIIAYDAAHGTSYMTTIRDNLAHICQDSYLTDKEIYAYNGAGDRNTVDNWGDWGTGKLAKEGGTGVCAMSLLDYDGQYQDVDRMDEAVKWVSQDLFQLGFKSAGAPESLLQIQTTEDGIWEEGSGYQDYHEPTTSYFMALYRYTFNQSLADIYPLAYGYATFVLRAFAPTGQYPQMTTSYAQPWYPQVNYYLSLNTSDTADYNLGTYFTNYAIVPNKGYRGSADGQGAGGDYRGYPELLLGYNASASMATSSIASWFFPQGTGAVLRSGYGRNDMYSYMRSAQNHTMSGHSSGTTQQLVFDIWAKGAYLIPDLGNSRFLGSPEDDQSLRIGRTTMLVNCSTCRWVTDGWTAIERDTKGTYGAMDNPSSITTNLFSNNLNYIEGNMIVSYYQNISGSDAYVSALPTPYSWTRGEMMVDNNYIITFDELSSSSSRQWGMMIPFGDTNGHTDANPVFNYARGNLTIDGTDYSWYDRVNGNPILFSISNAQKIIWKSASETNTVDTTQYPVNMTVFLNPTSNIDEIGGHMHYGTYGQNAEWNVPLVRVKQSGTNIKYLTVYYPTTTGDVQPAITTLTVTGGSGNDYATRINHGGASDIVTFSDGETITAGNVVTNAESSFSDYNNTLQYFFLTKGSRFDYGGLNQLTATNTLTTVMMNYSGNNRSIVAVGTSGTTTTIYTGQCDSGTAVYRNGTLQTKGVNWDCVSSTNLWISMTFSSPSQYDVIQGHPTTQKASNIMLTSSAGWNIYEGPSTLTCTTDAVGIIPSLYVNGVGVTNPYSSQWNAGVYSVICNFSATLNYFSNSTTNILTVAHNGGGGCSENWNCTSWSSCMNSQQTRTCTDLNSCGTTINKPAENQSCTGGCSENWICTSWSGCANNQQTRTCTDANSCNTTVNKPSQTQSCTSPPPSGGGNNGGGGGGGGGSGGGGTVGCYESWSCTSWSECSDDKQKRKCTDSSYCGTSRNKPPETQPCASDLEILMLPTEIRVNNGSSVDFELTASVKGTESDLRLNLTGIPDDWVSITPKKFEYAITDTEVKFSVNLTAPPNANGTRDIQFQLVGSNLNSTVYAASLFIIIPRPQQCGGMVCKGYTVLDADKCICVCNITCPDVTDLDTASCVCKHSAPISRVPPTPPPQRQGQNAILDLFAIGFIVFLLQLTWVIPLVTFLRLKRII